MPGVARPRPGPWTHRRHRAPGSPVLTAAERAPDGVDRVLSVARLRSSVTSNVNTCNTDSGAIMAYMTRGLVAVTAALALSVTGGVLAPAQADPRETAKTPTA